MKRSNARINPPMVLDFDAEAAEEKALVRLRQASASAPGSLFALRSGGVVLEVVAAVVAVAGTVWATVLLLGSGDVLDSPRPAVAAGVFVVAGLIALVIAVAGQLLVAQAAVARNTRLMTSILAELNHTVTSTAVASRPSVPLVVTAIPDTARAEAVTTA
jgi:hypothetical protein